jgi:hypothetical protein
MHANAAGGDRNQRSTLQIFLTGLQHFCYQAGDLFSDQSSNANANHRRFYRAGEGQFSVEVTIQGNDNPVLVTSAFENGGIVCCGETTIASVLGRDSVLGKMEDG